jgi:hypothetical protein
MTHDLKTGALVLLALVPATACNEEPRAEVDTNDTMTPTTGITTANPTTEGDETGEVTTGGMGSSETTDGPGSTTTGGDPVCETVQCGADCCAEGQECVLGECREACDSGVRCGEELTTCCDAGDVCLNPECVTPGAACIDSFDCPEGEFCEPTLGACLPQQDPVLCEIEPDFEEVEVMLEWSAEEEMVITMPMVADIDGDDLPEVVVNTWFHEDAAPGNANDKGIIRVLDGTNGNEQFRVEENPPMSYGSFGRTTAGLADVDGNGLPDIIYAGRRVIESGPAIGRSVVHAVNGLGTPLWSSHGTDGQPYHLYLRNGAPSFANFDDDEESEIVWGAAIIDNDGTVVADVLGNQNCSVPGATTHTGCGGAEGSPREPDPYIGGISAIADVTGDGQPEIVSGQRAWTVTWNTVGGQPMVDLQVLWDAGPGDGYPAIANIDLDENNTPEVVLVAAGEVRILDGATGELWCGIDPTGAACEANDAARTQPFALPGGGRGGPPTIADFDGDGRPEIGIAGATAYTLFDINRTDEDIVQPAGDAPPAPGEIFVRWSNATQEDTFSQSTGSSVFDFQGDGTAEVLYNDQCHMYVYNGETGEVILQLENSTATIHEYPLVADIDADGNSEFLVVANDRDIDADPNPCPVDDGYTYRRGVFAYGDPGDQWVRTRRVWTSHAYHVTNAESTGVTPMMEQNNWEVPGLNNYRQNVQGSGVFNAPDLSLDLSVSFNSCLDEEFGIVATVRNEGSLGVPAGIEVSLYEGEDATGTFIGTKATETPLLPGEFVEVTWAVAAPGGTPKQFYASVDEVDDVSVVNECDEGNNNGSTETVACPPAG